MRTNPHACLPGYTRLGLEQNNMKARPQSNQVTERWWKTAQKTLSSQDTAFWVDGRQVEGNGAIWPILELLPHSPSYDQNPAQTGCRGCECNRLIQIIRKNGYVSGANIARMPDTLRYLCVPPFFAATQHFGSQTAILREHDHVTLHP
jgi:hypothetical protein